MESSKRFMDCFKGENLGVGEVNDMFQALTWTTIENTSKKDLQKLMQELAKALLKCVHPDKEKELIDSFYSSLSTQECVSAEMPW